MTDPTYYFSYVPVNVVPEIAAGAFVAIAGVLLAQTFKAQGPRWLLVLPATALCEAAGYGMRTVCIYWTTLGTFTATSLLLLLPPNALALTNYKALGDVIRESRDLVPAHRRPRVFLLKPRFITWFFFGSDVLSFLLQGAGVAISTQSGRRALAKQTVLAGLYMQLFFLAVFLGITTYAFFDQRFTVARGPRDAGGQQAKRRLFAVVSLTTVLLYVRSVYRVAEFVDGYGGRIYGAEYLFYVCDTVPVLASFGVYMQSFLGHHLGRRAGRVGGTCADDTCVDPAGTGVKLHAYQLPPAGAGQLPRSYRS
ncbi:hypothetical protein IWQ56_002143 [Coemansia nantahalensis]|uniref:Uncharacterized protein n=1 Tax=Coemansia helicoidea TaxID=1286919 RepID=A0ACC1L8V0_9FUNG|nr:hypothetical protein IWQ56_002143 [Coemansia nantahalensis]KAJ2802890.1 hypothetical protein H4R21_002245 [Coemansia helicoidea]